MMKVFSVLQRLKGLRGTALDIFGYCEERRLERADIEGYLTILEAVKSGLTKENYKDAIELCELPLGLKGYGPVKAANREKMCQQQTRLLKQFRGEPGKFKNAA